LVANFMVSNCGPDYGYTANFYIIV